MEAKGNRKEAQGVQCEDGEVRERRDGGVRKVSEELKSGVRR